MKSNSRLLFLGLSLSLVVCSPHVLLGEGDEESLGISESIPATASAETPAEAVADQAPAKRVNLVTMEFPGAHWAFFSGKKDAVIGDTWSAKTDPKTKETTLICTGEPYGYVMTKKSYQNYRFGLEWKFPIDANGNSGVLIHTSGENRIWPKSIQIQLHQPVAGSTFPSTGAKTNNELRNVPMLSKPVNQWNTCVITSRDGVISVTVNDEMVGVVTGSDPNQGMIALQSEGAEVHFRNVWVEELPATPSPKSETPPADNPKPKENSKPEENAAPAETPTPKK